MSSDSCHIGLARVSEKFGVPKSPEILVHRIVHLNFEKG